MGDIRSKISQLYSLEQLSEGDSPIHRLHPLVKLTVTLVYLLCVVSFGRYQLGRLTPYLFYPIFLMSLAEIPWGMFFKRVAIALPFCLFAGVSNLLLDRAVFLRLGTFPVTGGIISLAVILLRTFLCVSSVLILVAVTPLSLLTGQLRRMHMPEMAVLLFEMIYRYIAVIAQEASNMVTAYRLRGNGARWPELKYFGAFIGQLLLRSTARAERVYYAMQCRLYGNVGGRSTKRPLTEQDWIFLAVGCGTCILFRLFNLPVWLGGLWL